jgi:hypothetical protein
MRMRLWLAGAIALAAMTLAACDESLSTIAGPTPNLEPRFSNIQQFIFEASDPSGRAGCTQCHTDAGGRTPPTGMNLRHETAYATLVNVPSTEKPGLMRVQPGDPENSYLVHKLEGRSDIVGQRMPRTSGPFLTEGQIRIIRRWIERGAPND